MYVVVYFVVMMWICADQWGKFTHILDDFFIGTKETEWLFEYPEEYGRY